VSSAGAEANGNSFFVRITPDGRYISFVSNATTLDGVKTTSHHDAWRRDLQTNTTTLVSVATSGGSNRESYGITDISPDGRYVLFPSWASNLVAGDTNGMYDAFIRDVTGATTTLVSVSTAGALGNGHVRQDGMSLSSDGRYAVFSSAATNLVASDTNGTSDVFFRDTQGPTTTLLSATGAAVQGNGLSRSAYMLPDGTRAFFESVATNLVSGDTNAASDIFMIRLP
jgi:Tol biopolymer transport system component